MYKKNTFEENIAKIILFKANPAAITQYFETFLPFTYSFPFQLNVISIEIEWESFIFLTQI